MKAAHFSSLLPEVFRHKDTKVRLLRPKAILLDFHGTIAERRWEETVIFPYVKKSLAGYLKAHWDDDAIQQCVASLRMESFEQGFKNRYEEAPVIDEPADQAMQTAAGHSPHQSSLDATHMAQQVANFVLWQISSRKETKETRTIQHLVWTDGFKRGLLKVPIYPDVLANVRAWHEKYKCHIYVISSLDSSTLELFMETTESGNLQQYLAGSLGSQKPGHKLLGDTYKSIYETILVSSAQVFRQDNSKRAQTTEGGSNLSSPGSSSISGRASKGGSPRSPRSPGRRNKSSKPPSDCLSNNKSPTGSDINSNERPILFITDSGQEAKAASSVLDGSVYECLLISRPGNRRIRSYYLSQFQYIEQFGDIEFV